MNINEDGGIAGGVGTAAVGTNLPNGKEVPNDNAKIPKKPKTAFSKIVRNPAVTKVSSKKIPKTEVNDYFPEPASNKPPKGSLGGAALSKKLDESLQRVKFVYTGKNATVRNPEVMVLDPNYDGQSHWKNYGKKDYLLGYNLSHVANKNEAITSIQDVSDFTTLLGSEDDKEYYERLKQLYPESISFIRAYKKGDIVNPKILDDNGNETSIKLSELKSARVNRFGF